MLYIHTTYGCAASTNVVDTHVTTFRAGGPVRWMDHHAVTYACAASRPLALGRNHGLRARGDTALGCVSTCTGGDAPTAAPFSCCFGMLRAPRVMPMSISCITCGSCCIILKLYYRPTTQRSPRHSLQGHILRGFDFPPRRIAQGFDTIEHEAREARCIMCSVAWAEPSESDHL
jgi:hypothetical protein